MLSVCYYLMFVSTGEGGGCFRCGALVGGHCNIIGPYPTLPFAPLGGPGVWRGWPLVCRFARGTYNLKSVPYLLCAHLSEYGCTFNFSLAISLAFKSTGFVNIKFPKRDV